MYLFILESIGTQELILIGIIALIVFGPRKLPELARTIGKTMADVRKVTSDFRQTWEKEVEEDKKMLNTLAEDPLTETNNIQTNTIQPIVKDNNALSAPQIKELSPEEIEKIFNKNKVQEEPSQFGESKTEPVTLGKRDWI